MFSIFVEPKWGTRPEQVANGGGAWSPCPIAPPLVDVK